MNILPPDAPPYVNMFTIVVKRDKWVKMGLKGPKWDNCAIQARAVKKALPSRDYSKTYQLL